MLEVYGNLWDYPAEVHVITTNGFVKANGECVMGRGCAKEAALMYPSLPRTLGWFIKTHGNVPARFRFQVGGEHRTIWTMPVKRKWWERADLDLIQSSAHQLVEMANQDDIKTIVMPRPGSGNGRLDWYTSVKPAIEHILDDRFHVITFGRDT